MSLATSLRKPIPLGLVLIAFWLTPTAARAGEDTELPAEQAPPAAAAPNLEQDIESHLGRELKRGEKNRIDAALEGHTLAVRTYESLSDGEKTRLHDLWDRKYAKARASKRNQAEPNCAETEVDEKRERFFCTNAGIAQVVGIEVYACKRRSGGRFLLTQAKLGLSFEAHAGVFIGRGDPQEGIHFGASGGMWILAGGNSIAFEGVSGVGLGVGLGIDASASMFLVQNIHQSSE